MLICVAPEKSYNPMRFESISSPFPYYVWLILLLAVGLMSLCLMIRRADFASNNAFGSSLASTLTPFVNQISDPEGGFGIPSGYCPLYF